MINYDKYIILYLGIELVHDDVEKSLLQEVEELRTCQSNFRDMLNKVLN